MWAAFVQQEDVKKLERALEQATGDVDILLTCEWPADVTAATLPGSAPAEASSAGDPAHNLDIMFMYYCSSCMGRLPEQGLT